MWKITAQYAPKVVSTPFRKLPERPRERLMEEGVDRLSLQELLAIVLETGTKGKTVLQLAEEMLVRFGDLNGVLDASIAELTEIKGIGKAKAIKIRAIFGLFMRSKKPQIPKHKAIDTPKLAYEIAKSEIAHCKQEMLFVILRGAKGKLIGHETVAIGTLSEVLVHPREVFFPAVKHKARSLIVAHNHPSGDPTPSQADLQLTRRLFYCSQVMGIGLDDHLIVCPDAFISLREQGLLGKPFTYS